MGLLKSPEKMFRSYTEEERESLKSEYTPEQIKVIEAGEEAIRPEDLDRYGIIRSDLGRIKYIDDFSHLQPVYDKKPADNTPYDPNARLMTQNEMGHSFLRSLDKVEAENPNPEPADELERDSDEWVNYSRKQRLNLTKAQYQMETFMGTNGPLPWVPDLTAPTLPRKFLDDAGSGSKTATEDELLDPEGVYAKLRKQTGLSMADIIRLNVKILVRHRVVNQTRLGKIESMYCLAIAGNGNGRLGIGEAKGQEGEDTQMNARIAAIRNMQPVPRYEERTIFGEVDGKVSAVEVKLMARPPGASISDILRQGILTSGQDLASDANTISLKWLAQQASMTSQHEFPELGIR